MYFHQIWIMARRGSGTYSDISLDNLSYKNGLCVEEPVTPLPDPEVMWYCGFDGTDEKECIGEKNCFLVAISFNSWSVDSRPTLFLQV